MMEWTGNTRLAAIAAERGLSKGGFRRSLQALVTEFVSCEENREGEFLEWFGERGVIPAAYRIRRDECCDHIQDVTVEVYEVEGTVELSESKWQAYGLIADGDGPRCELHILDKYDHEIVVPCADLMQFCFIDGVYKSIAPELFKAARRMATVQHHAPVVIDDQRVAVQEREIRLLKRQLMKGEYSQIAGTLQEIIYGLGLGETNKSIAQRASVNPVVVRATARLLHKNAVDPKHIVRDTHARWKAAYDAVRELGIQL